MPSLALSFNEVKLNPVIQADGQIYLTANELAQALDYKSVKSVSNLYNSNKDEFTTSMSLVIESVTNGINNSKRKLKVRIFSLRGCHLVAMFARTDVAKQFRKWVLDVLDKVVGKPVAKTHKEERAPLTSAVNLLVAKTKHLNYSEAYKLVHQRFNVEHINEIPYDALPNAVEYVHHLIALYSKVEAHNFKSFGQAEYELVRKLAEAILFQNSRMSNVWRALNLIDKNSFELYNSYVKNSNCVAREVSEFFQIKSDDGEPLIEQNCKWISFSSGLRLHSSPHFFNYSV